MRVKFIIAFFFLSLSSHVAAQGGLGIPQPGSDQSGIGLVSGFRCNANRIDVSFDGGPLIEAAYGTTRTDTVGVCGDANNGFGLLWNYNLLSPGEHTVALFEDGKQVDSASFTVTTLGEEFLQGASQEVRVLGFPESASDVILKWQQSNQNFVISEYLKSRDSFNVTGNWSAYSGADFVLDLNIFTATASSDPELSEVFMTIGIVEDGGVFFADGAMKQNILVGETGFDSGAPFEMSFEIVFTGPQSGTLTLTDCAPSVECEGLTGGPLDLEKFFPLQEAGVSQQSAEGEEQSSDVRAAIYRKKAQIQRVEELLERADDLEGGGDLEGESEQPKRQPAK